MKLNTAMTIAAIAFSSRRGAAVSAFSTSAAAVESGSKVAVPGLKNGMDYVTVGSSDLVVSKVCMGTMTFGEQNTLKEGVQQLNRAWDEYGINFLDTAEMYPVPTKAETQGNTDRTVAAFLKERRREDVILASKVSGRSPIDWLRKDKSATKLTREQILESVDSSLKRLGTDYIDLLQLHWPDRYTGGQFGGSCFSPSQYKDCTPFEEQLSALQEVVAAGKVRYIGLSNETPYGVCSMSELAKANSELYPKIVSIQNSYSLVVRKDYETGLAEACYHHDVALLPYSPLCGGVLTGKYSNTDTVPKNARLLKYPGFMERYLKSLNKQAVDEYSAIAKDVGLTPTELALSWCYHRELVTSTIIGATSLAQLDENVKAYDIHLDDSVSKRISKVYEKYPDPTKSYSS